jgi:hypothetical protein
MPRGVRQGTHAFIALGMWLVVSAAATARESWPRDPASDVAIFATLLRYRIHAEHCSSSVPELKAQFASVVSVLTRRVQGISVKLLASDEFKGTKHLAVPSVIIDALSDSFEDSRHNVERLQSASNCQKTLLDFRQIDDEALEAGLAANLAAVQNMSQKLVRAGALHAR